MAYWNGAHPSLQLPHLKPNHIYELGFTGMVHSHQAPNQHFTVELPVETVFVHAYTPANQSLCKDMVLDTVLVDIEKRRIDCNYRTSFAEELEIASCQLRFIARHERGGGGKSPPPKPAAVRSMNLSPYLLRWRHTHKPIGF